MGGAVRVLLLHHVTFSINSPCHFFGRRPFATGDQSRNLAWLAPLALGEAWHNNHHAFPTSARHGLGRRQLDPSAWLITGLERCHLAWGRRPDQRRTSAIQTGIRDGCMRIRPTVTTLRRLLLGRPAYGALAALLIAAIVFDAVKLASGRPRRAAGLAWRPTVGWCPVDRAFGYGLRDRAGYGRRRR
jgi:hypothetical protein